MRLNETANIVTQNLTESFIDLRGFGLTSQVIPELCFNHAERGFDVRAFMIVLHELLCVAAVIVKHSFPNRTAPILTTHRAALKRNGMAPPLWRTRP